MALSVDACKSDNDLLESCERIAFCKTLLGSRKQKLVECFGSSRGGLWGFVKDP